MPVIVQIWDAQNQEVTRRVRATSRRIASKVAEVLHDGPQRLSRKQTGRRHGEDRASYWFKLYTKRTDTPSRGRWPGSAFGGKADICGALVHVCFSNRPVWVKRFQAIQPLQCRCRLRARASLRTRRQGPSSMGFENEGNNLWVGLTVK